MNNKKMVKMGMSLALVGVIGVGATFAYLQSTAGPLNNTFALGQGYPEKNAVVLDETFVPVDENDQNNNPSPVDGKGRTTVGNFYNVNVGSTITKDPRVSLSKESPNSYVFVGIEGEDALGDKVTTHINTNGDYYWNKVDGDKDTVDGIYVYSTNRSPEADRAMKVDPSLSQSDYMSLRTVFDQVTIENMNNSEANDLRETMKKTHIKVYAVAVQADDVKYEYAKTQAMNTLKQAMNRDPR